MSRVRTRFAPSPTGFLHIGGARTALFNWAFARRHAGALVLRVEDTDRERSTRENEAAVLDGLSWLGIEWDEGPVRQSERALRYAEVIEDLLARGLAYRCTCTREELEARREATITAGRNWVYDGRCRDAAHGPGVGPHAVRLHVPPEGRLEWNDLVFGPSGQDAREIGDMIIRRSDGAPLFHLAGAVDDVDMGITHVIRGADHHSNTPFQLAIYAALGATPPVLAHVPLIVGPGGKKLSKRRDDVSVQSFRERGYLPQALRNWLVRVGWSHGDQEIFSAEEIVALFDLGAVHRASAHADPGKLDWLNQHYLKTLPGDELLRLALPFLEARAEGPVQPTPELARLLDLQRERSKTLDEMAERSRFFWVSKLEYEEKAARKHLRPEIAPVLAGLAERLVELPEWSEPALEAAFEAARASHGDLPLGKLAQPVRVAVTGGTASPGIFETLAVLGRERTLERLREAVRFAEQS